jgi:hypothetical protein
MCNAHGLRSTVTSKINTIAPAMAPRQHNHGAFLALCMARAGQRVLARTFAVALPVRFAALYHARDLRCIRTRRRTSHLFLIA